MSLNVFSGGVNTSFSTELNENFDILKQETNLYSSNIDTSEYNGDGDAVVKTFTYTLANNEIVIGLQLECDVKSSNGDQCTVGLQGFGISTTSTTSLTYVSGSAIRMLTTPYNEAFTASFPISVTVNNAGAGTCYTKNIKVSVISLIPENIVASSAKFT